MTDLSDPRTSEKILCPGCGARLNNGDICVNPNCKYYGHIIRQEVNNE